MCVFFFIAVLNKVNLMLFGAPSKISTSILPLIPEINYIYVRYEVWEYISLMNFKFLRQIFKGNILPFGFCYLNLEGETSA